MLNVGDVRIKHTFPAPPKSKTVWPFHNNGGSKDTKRTILIVLELCLESSLSRRSSPYHHNATHFPSEHSWSALSGNTISTFRHVAVKQSGGLFFGFRVTLHKDMKSLKCLHCGERERCILLLTLYASTDPGRLGQRLLHAWCFSFNYRVFI